MLLVPSTAVQNSAHSPRRSWFAGWTQRLALAAGVFVFAGFIAVVAGFVWFLWKVPTTEVVIDRNADGIVALTGGPERITDAVRLLAAGRGKRLLITGVHRTTNLSEIARLMPAHESMVTCCVDLDHSAMNTVGNAVETRRWAATRGFHSLIIVTSNYHMPRTLAELKRKLPGITLIPFPVITDKLRSEGWWADTATARLLLAEYVKYVLAQLRIRLDEPLAASRAPDKSARS